MIPVSEKNLPETRFHNYQIISRRYRRILRAFNSHLLPNDHDLAMKIDIWELES